MATCLKCEGAAACDCFVTGAGFVTVTGVGTEGDPYVADVTCETIQGCVGPMLNFIGFGSDFTAGGDVGDVLTAGGSGFAAFAPLG